MPERNIKLELNFKDQNWENWYRKIIDEGRGQLPDPFIWKTFEGIDIEPAFAGDNRPESWHTLKDKLNWRTALLIRPDQSKADFNGLDADHWCFDGLLPDSTFLKSAVQEPIYLIDQPEPYHITSTLPATEPAIANTGLDPIASLAKSGRWIRGEKEDFEDLVHSVQAVIESSNVSRAILCDARIVHLAGGNAVQELGYALATGKAYLDTLTGAGIDPEAASANIDFCFSIASDFFIQTSKLRVFRTLWQRVVSEYGVKDNPGTGIIAMTSGRSLTASDAHTNLLRTAEQALAAVLGGCDVLVVRPFDNKLKTDGLFSNRLAINIQHILKYECRLVHRPDPLAGAWYSDAICHRLAQHAWDYFTEIEKKGGLLEALKCSFVQDSVKNSASILKNAVITGEKTVVGYNKYCDKARSAVEYGTLVEKCPVSETETMVVPFDIFSIPTAKDDDRP